jgi:L-iditol 2-dehydrogenase
VQLGDTVAIIGSGPIGAMHVAISKARGASCVILADIDGDRLQLAKRVGADYLVNSKETDLESFIMEKTNGRGVDIAITAASVPEAQNQALGIVRKGGKVSFFAGLPKEKALHPVDANIIHYREVSVFGAYGSSVQQNILDYKLIQSGVVDAGTIISDVIPFENLVDGLERVKRGDGLKIVVEI